MSEKSDSSLCQSKSQEGMLCVRKHAHKALHHSNGKGGYWIGGSKKKATATFPKPPKREPRQGSDSSYLSEADYQSWASNGYFF